MIAESKVLIEDDAKAPSFRDNTKMAVSNVQTAKFRVFTNPQPLERMWTTSVLSSLKANLLLMDHDLISLKQVSIFRSLSL